MSNVWVNREIKCMKIQFRLATEYSKVRLKSGLISRVNWEKFGTGIVLTPSLFKFNIRPKKDFSLKNRQGKYFVWTAICKNATSTEINNHFTSK